MELFLMFVMMVADPLSTVVDIAVYEGPIVQIKSAGRKKRSFI
jgi:hypothetical protein